MPLFDYKGLDGSGNEVDGRVTATDRIDAIKQLEHQSISPFKLEIRQTSKREFERSKARPKDRQRFMRQLAVLLRAGMPLLDAFEVVVEDEICKDLAEQAEAVRRALRSGSRLSASIVEHMTELPEYAPRLIELGEATGDLPKALNDIAAQMEQDLRAAAEVRNALAYPSFLAVMGVFAILFIFLFVVPRFANLIGDNRDQLPGLSRIVIETGLFMRGHMVEMAVMAAIAIAGLYLLLRQPAVRAAFVELAFKMPVVGGFLRSADTARWARISGTALDGGAGLLDALALAEMTQSSSSRRQNLVETRRAIRSGEAIEVALRAQTDFDPVTINIIRTGRMSSSLGEMMLFLAEMYETEAKDRAKQLTSIAEPMAIAFIASVIGVIVISLVMAMSSLYDIAL